MFSATLDKQTLDSALTSVSVLVDECKIHMNEGGITIRAVDPANVGMVDMNLNSNAFESYQSDGELIGVDLTKFNDIVSMGDNDSLFNLEFDNKTRKLLIEVDGLEYTLSTLETSSIQKEPDIPDMDLPATVIGEGRSLNQAIKAADMIGEYIEFGVDADENVFYSQAEGDVDDIYVERNEEELIDINAGDANSIFSLEYLKSINNAIDDDSEVTIELGQEFPMRISLNFAEGHGQLTYMVAPRIKS